jgi:hypothetical protein
MARGDSKRASAYEYNKGLGAYNNSTDVFKWSLVTNTYASITENAATLNLSNVTVIASAGNYVAGTTIANTTWTQLTDTSTLDGDDFSFAADGANPITVKCLVIYNDTSAADDIVKVVDITTDGTTDVDTTQGFTYTVNASGIVETQVNV